MPPLTAYHVSTEDDLRTIKTNVCDDPRRDGHLYGARVACFTTTLYKGELPGFSPYPRSYDEGDSGYRYKMKFDPHAYNRFLMAETTERGVTQVHFLLLDKRCPREKVVAAFVRAFLRATNKHYNEKADWKTYFPNKKANDYANGKVFVNVMFWHSVPVKKARFSGSHAIEKKGPDFEGDSVDDNMSWLERLLERIPVKENKDDRRADELANDLDSTRI